MVLDRLDLLNGLRQWPFTIVFSASIYSNNSFSLKFNGIGYWFNNHSRDWIWKDSWFDAFSLDTNGMFSNLRFI